MSHLLPRTIFLSLLGTLLLQSQPQGPAGHILSGPNLPAKCSHMSGDVFFKTTGGVSGVMYQCTATNTWTGVPLASGAGVAGAGIIIDGGTGEIKIDNATVPFKGDIQSGAILKCTGSASATVPTCAMSPTLALANLIDGATIMFLPGLTCAGAPTTLNIDTLGALPIYEADGATSGSCTAGVPLWLTVTDTHTKLRKQAGGTGGGGKRVIATAGVICQSGVVVGIIGNTPAVNAPTGVCITSVDSPVTVMGVLQFADSASQSVQLNGLLPTDWTGSLTLYLEWRSAVANAALNAVWQIQTKCFADGETIDSGAWNAAQAVTDANKAVANQANTITPLVMTVTGCAAGEHLSVYLFRDPAHASDTLAATAELIQARVTE